MVEIKCPACGVMGRVSKDKVNTRLVCNKCLKVFHLTATGRAMPGEPPQPSSAAGRAPREQVEWSYGLDVPPWVGRVTRSVFSPKVLSVVGGLILLAGGYIAISIIRGESLQGRTVKLARATVMGDLQTLLELSASGTSDELLKWYVAVQPRCDELKQVMLTPTPFVEVVVNSEDTSSGTASVVARITNEGPLTRTGTHVPGVSISPASAGKSIELPLELTSEGMGGWKLDGKRTLEAIPKKNR